MSDIFISYNREDRPWVEQLSKALASNNWSVWWDRNIPTGESFDLVIKQALTSAKCVVVVWSTRSVNSDWVKAEAEEARKRKVLLPIRIEDVELPLGFSRLQTQSLVGWEADADHDGFRHLLRDITRLVGAAPAQLPTAVNSRWQGLRPLLTLSLPTILMALIVLGLKQWTIATTVQLDLTTERVEFVVEASQAARQPIVTVVNARSLSIEKFSTLTFKPATIELAVPSYSSHQTDSAPPSTWLPLTLSASKITFIAENARLHPRLTLELPSVEGQDGLKLATTAVAGTRVVLEARGSARKDDQRGRQYDGLTIKQLGQGNTTLEVHGTLLLTADYAHITGVSMLPVQGQQERTYRSRLGNSTPWIDIEGRTDGPLFSPTFSSDQPTPVASKGIPVEEIEFTVLDHYGDRISALTGNGRIVFPGYPHLERVELAQGETIGITGLTGFVITQVTLHPHGGGLRVVGEGMANEVRTKNGAIPIPHRLTAFDALWHNRVLTAFLFIVLWIFPTTVGAYRHYQVSR